MPDPSSAPRRVSLGYILGFSDKPYKDPKPPPPPRPRRPSQLAELVASPGGLVEWTASDGRKGRLTGMGKPQLTAASLAKVPSEIQPTKEHSKKSTYKNPASNPENLWTTGGWDNVEATGGSIKSTSKKAPSSKNNAWKTGDWNPSGSNKGSQKAASCTQVPGGSGDPGDLWQTQAGTSADDTKKEGDKEDEKKAKKKSQMKDEKNDGKSTEQATKSGDSNETPASTNTVTEQGSAKKPDDTNTWTKEEDEQLLQMKTENASWKNIQDKFGKTRKQCAERWNIVKAAGGKPDNANNNAGKGDASQKKDNKLDEEKQNQGTKDSKKDNSKEEDKKDAEVPDVPWGDTFEETFGETSDDKQGEAEKANDGDTWGTGDPTNTGNTDDAKDSGDLWAKVDGAGDSKDKDSGDLWGQGIWDTTNQETNLAAAPNIPQSAAPAKPASPPRSTKAPSEARSRRSSSSKSKSTATRPAEIELEPDDTFSADDLRLIARILQQDCSMVWSRLSWRFRDKTGRTLDPEVFEKKITGTVEGEGRK